ncbi:hypothetical protein VP01_5115g1, partial [Puccinia sorghi]
ASDLSNQANQKENSPHMSSEEEGGEGANLNLSGVAHLPVHISNPEPNAMNQFFKNFITFQIWILLSKPNTNISAKITLLTLPIKIKISQMGHNIWGRCIVSKDPERYHQLQNLLTEQNTFIGKQFYSISVPLFDEVKQKHNALNEPGLEPNFKEDPNGCTCHLSFTISSLANLNHKDYDSSPFTFFMWIPIKQTMGNLVEDSLEVQGGEFVFPYYSCGINLSGFNFIVEFSWKATEYSQLNLPSHTLSKFLHTCVGLSCQLTENTQAALEKIKNKFYENDPTKSNLLEL